MKRILLIMLGLAMMLTAVACATNEAEKDTTGKTDAPIEPTTEIPTEEPEKTVDPLPVTEASVSEHLEDIFRPLGRSYIKDEKYHMDFACSGIHFKAECEGTVKLQVFTHRKVALTIYIDGERSPREPEIETGPNGVYLTIAKDLERGVHEFRIVNRTQFIWGNVSFGNVRINGSFLDKPAERELFLEFYGDSILNGSNVRMGGSSVANSDSTQAFGWLTAEALNADMNLIGCGGIGLTKNKRSFVMKDIVEYCGAQYSLDTNAAGGYLLPHVPKYDFKRIPDAVIIEQGVNDGADASTQKFKDALSDMINTLREKYGKDVPIVVLTGYTAGRYYNAAIPTIIKDLGGESANLYICELSNASASKDIGGDGTHPNVETSKKMAEELTAYLKELLNK
jgi:lysophospholipase L1-like esterase